jgi:hypothetical protein
VSPRRWWRRRRWAARRKKAAEATRDEPLREFVYLDDVSVYSLLASRIGALATEFTESESTSLSSEIKASGGVTTPVAKSQLSSSVKSTASSGGQVMRRATVQSTFRELYSYIRHALVLSLEQPGSAPSLRTAAELRAEAARESPWVLAPSRLSRGEMIEIEVALDADDTFRAGTVLSTLYGFLRELPELPDSVDRESFSDAVTGMRLLDGLLAGVVPVRGRALEFEVVTVEDDEFIVHRDVATCLGSEATRRPLVVVGICESEMFWRDLRRVLFSGSHFRMLCRVNTSGVTDDWRAVKLADVLEGVVPGLEGVLEQIPAMLAQAKEDASDESSDEKLRATLTLYAIDLAEHYGRELTRARLDELGLPTTQQVAAIGAGLKQRRAAFDELTASLAETLAYEVDPVVASRMRTTALLDSQVLDLVGEPASGVVDAPRSRSQQRYLECEVVAVYW